MKVKVPSAPASHPRRKTVCCLSPLGPPWVGVGAAAQDYDDDDDDEAIKSSHEQ